MKKLFLLSGLAAALIFSLMLPVQALEMGGLTSSSVASRETTYYTVTVTVGDGGSVFPGGSNRMKEGSSRFFTITPNAGFAVSDVKVNGTSVGPVTGYRVSNISMDIILEVTFTPVSSTAAVSSESESSSQEETAETEKEDNNPNTGAC